jgi:hypothetical protein
MKIAQVAQEGFNLAMSANPITLIIWAIVLVIAAIYMIVAAINEVEGTSISATGVIIGAFFTLGATLNNVGVGLVDLAFGVINTILNLVIDVIDFVYNFMDNKVSSIIYLFADVADVVLSLLQTIASAIDSIFGCNLANAVQGWRDTMSSNYDYLVEEFAPNENYNRTEKINLSASDLGMQRISYSDAYSDGYYVGESLKNKFTSGTTTSTSPISYVPASELDIAKETKDNTAKTASNTSAIKDSLDITSENLKYIRDYAEQRVVNRMIQNDIKLEITNNNNVSSDTDVDGMVESMTKRLRSEMAAVAEGV